MNLKRRLAALKFLVLLSFIMVLGRAFFLQLIPEKRLEDFVKRKSEKSVEIVGRRGSIVDREGRVLAVSVNTQSVYANPSVIKNIREVTGKLSEALDLSAFELRRKLARSRTKKFVWIKRQLSESQLQRFENLNLEKMPGVGSVPEFRREFPHGRTASHILGFVSVDGIGLEGVEASMEDTLGGKKIKIFASKDAKGRLIFTKDEQIRFQDVGGQNLQLSLDAKIQFHVEKILKTTVLSNKARAGTALVMDARNGELVSLANFPDFDPNAPSATMPSARRNRAITDPYEPGSVVKAFLVAKAVEDKVVNAQTIVDAGSGKIRIGSTVIGEADKKHEFKKLNVQDLLKHSSNVAVVNLQRKMGFDRVEEVFRRLGFGQKTGLSLLGESRGIVRYPKKNQELEKATISFGQGIALTPLQVLTAFNALGTGSFIKPSVLKKRFPVEQRKVFSAATVKEMRRMLKRVTDVGASGEAARLPEVSVAGKTGTSQKVDFKNGGYKEGAYWSSFAAFFPAEDPKWTILVMIDEPDSKRYYGSQVAAPAVREIALTLLRHFPQEEFKKETLKLSKNSP